MAPSSSPKNPPTDGTSPAVLSDWMYPGLYIMSLRGWRTSHSWVAGFHKLISSRSCWSSHTGWSKSTPISPTSITLIRSSSRQGQWSRSSGNLTLFLLPSTSCWSSHRDPWWVFTTCSLFYTIKRLYNFGIIELVTVSPRFGIMLASMCLSIAFIIIDTCVVLNAFPAHTLPTGVEPFWKVSSPSQITLRWTATKLHLNSCHLSSNVSATPSSSTTSKQHLIECETTGYGNRQGMAKSFFQKLNTSPAVADMKRMTSRRLVVGDGAVDSESPIRRSREFTQGKMWV